MKPYGLWHLMTYDTSFCRLVLWTCLPLLTAPEKVPGLYQRACERHGCWSLTMRLKKAVLGFRISRISRLLNAIQSKLLLQLSWIIDLSLRTTLETFEDPNEKNHGLIPESPNSGGFGDPWFWENHHTSQHLVHFGQCLISCLWGCWGEHIVWNMGPPQTHACQVGSLLSQLSAKKNP